MRLACADSTFPKLSHEVALAVIRDLDLEAVDVCVFPEAAHLTPAELLADPSGVAERVAERVEGAGLIVSDVFMILGFEELAANHPDAEVRAESLAHFEAAVGLAVRLGSPGVSTLPGMAFEGVEREVSLRLAAAELQRRAEIAGAAGLRFSVEPHVGSIVETPELTLELLDLAPDVTLALDHSHFVYQGFSQGDVDVLIPHAGHVHLRQAAEGAMQLPANEGVIDFRALARQLEQGGYDGFLTLEYQWEEWLDCRRVDCISETAELRDLVRG